MHFVRTWICLCVLAALATLSAAAPVQEHFAVKPRGQCYSHIVVFGDSMVDNGNGSYLLTNKTWPADPAYYRGRFSNGLTWPEQLAQHLGVSSVQDGAYGGATVNNSRVQGYTGYNSDVAVPDVLHQVKRYLARHGNKTDPNALYIVTGGSNDAFFGLQKKPQPIKLANQVATDLKHAEQQLAARGAKHLLVATLPSSNRSPYARQYSGKLEQAVLALFIHTFNTKVKQWAKQASARVSVVDLYEREEHILRHLKQYKLSNAQDACLVGTQKIEKKQRHLCAHPERYVYWDLYHPTAKMHGLLADAALEALRAE